MMRMILTKTPNYLECQDKIEYRIVRIYNILYLKAFPLYAH